jgi:hypothetical protein
MTQSGSKFNFVPWGSAHTRFYEILYTQSGSKFNFVTWGSQSKPVQPSPSQSKIKHDSELRGKWYALH